MSKRYIPYPDGDVCLDLTDRGKRLGPSIGHHPVVLSWPRPASGSSWALAPGTHNAPLFPTGEGSYPRREKENVFDPPSMGNQRTINVGMFQREFSNFLDSHFLWSLGIPLRLEVSIKCLKGDGFIHATVNPWSFSREGRLDVAESQTWGFAE